MYSGLHDEQDSKILGRAEGMVLGRKRGISFDVGHGGDSFKWSVANPLVKAGFIADKMLALGQPFPRSSKR